MATILQSKTINAKACKTIVKTKHGNAFYISSCWAFDHGWETLAFPYDPETGRITDWTEVYCASYLTCADMIKGHEYVVKNADELLER